MLPLIINILVKLFDVLRNLIYKQPLQLFIISSVNIVGNDILSLNTILQHSHVILHSTVVIIQWELNENRAGQSRQIGLARIGYLHRSCSLGVTEDRR